MIRSATNISSLEIADRKTLGIALLKPADLVSRLIQVYEDCDSTERLAFASAVLGRVVT